MMRVPIVRKRNTTGSGASFTPASLPGLFERWIANSSYMTLDGSNNISSWAGSYASRSLAQATGSQQPDYVSSYAGLGNKPAVRMVAATSDELNDAGTTDWNFFLRTDTGSGSYIAGCFYTPDSAPASPVPVAAVGADGTKSRLIVYSRNSSAPIYGYEIAIVNADGTYAGGMSYGPLSSTAVWFVISRAQGTGAASGLLTFDGSKGGTLGGNAPALNAGTVKANSTVPTRGLRLGRSGGSYGNSHWAEIIVGQGTLTASEMANLGSYFVSTYGAAP